ncbi:MAG TPA: hypothetical protein VNO35_11410 [Steroidobacteraceae bacterium]|nr:hypothetical protein [Steroidobacteraceae bacterium]
MPKRNSLAVLYFGWWCLTACVSTTFTSTWKAPDVEPVNPTGKTVAAVFVSSDEGRRRVAEDVLVRKLNERGAHGIAAYTLIPTEQLRDMNAVHTRLAQAGVEGVVVMRVIGKSQQISYTPSVATFPPYYRRLSGYWGYGWGAVYEPGYLRTDTLVSVETLVYSLEKDALLWAGTSRTTNPSNIDRFVDELADAVGTEMTKQGLLTK